MLKSQLLLYFFSILIAINYVTAARKTVLCYTLGWAVYRKGQGKFTIADIDPKLCTHIVYGFFGIDETTNEIKSRDAWADFITEDGDGLGQLSLLVKFKETVPDLKILFSVGGWEGHETFSDLSASTARRTTFVNSIFEFIRQHQLDGVDISWQFPTDRGGVPEDNANFVALLTDLRDKLKPDNKLITVQISSKRYVIDPGYDLKSMSNLTDFFNFMTYEYNGPWDKRTGINAPLKSNNELNVEFSVDYLIKKGATPSKILLGIPTYGHTFTMQNVSDNGKYLRVPSDGGYMSQWTRTKGLIAFYEACYELTTTAGWKEMWDEKSSTPYAINHKKFISYDNQRSVEEKMKLIKLKGLGGASIYTLDTDDFKGLCYGEKFPLVAAAKENLIEVEKPISSSTTATVSNSNASPESNTASVSNATIVSHIWG